MSISNVPEYRNKGLAVYQVNALTDEILKRNIVPCYGASLSNIAFQMVAYRAGIYACMDDWI